MTVGDERAVSSEDAIDVFSKAFLMLIELYFLPAVRSRLLFGKLVVAVAGEEGFGVHRLSSLGVWSACVLFELLLVSFLNTDFISFMAYVSFFSFSSRLLILLYVLSSFLP